MLPGFLNPGLASGLKESAIRCGVGKAHCPTLADRREYTYQGDAIRNSRQLELLITSGNTDAQTVKLRNIVGQDWNAAQLTAYGGWQKLPQAYTTRS